VTEPLPGKRRAAFALIAIVLGVVGGLVIGELGLRIFGVRPKRMPPPRYLALVDGAPRDFGNKWGRELRGGESIFHIKRPSTIEGGGIEMGEWIPGARFRIAYASNPRGYFDADNGVAVAINALGMRGPEVAAIKPAGAFRIVGIGDSFMFGPGVRDEDTYLRRLERALGGVEVLNGGVEGYNTRDEVASLERRWLALAPDLVLVGFYLNDAYNDAAFLNQGQELGLSLKPSGLARYSYIWDLVQHARELRRTQRRIEDYYRGPYFRSGGEGWAECKRALARLEALSRERGFRVALVIFPELHRLDGSYPFEEIHALVAKTARELSIPTLDLLPAFRGRGAEQLWVHPTDHHPNEIAHGLAAEAIAGFLRAERLTDRPAAPPTSTDRSAPTPDRPTDRSAAAARAR
jgi:hypothetical protein